MNKYHIFYTNKSNAFTSTIIHGETLNEALNDFVTNYGGWSELLGAIKI